MKRFLSWLLLLTLCFALVACGGGGNPGGDEGPQKTDEEMITDRINAFATAYNEGDLDGVMATFDAKTRNTYEAAFKLMEGINFGGSMGGMSISGNLDFSALFGLSVGMLGDEDLLNVQVTDIKISEKDGKRTAIAAADMIYEGVNLDGSEMIFDMVYEKNGWYINNVREGDSLTNDAEGTPDTSVTLADVIIADANFPENGYTALKIAKGSDHMLAIVDTQGKIVYRTSFSGFSWSDITVFENKTACLRLWHSNETCYTFVDLATGKATDMDPKYVGFTDIGGGFGYLMDEEEAYTLINTKGEIIKPATKDFDQILAQGGGYAWVYRDASTISSVETQYGVINSKGEWVMSMSSLASIGLEEALDVTYMGKNVFAMWGEKGLYFYDAGQGRWIGSVQNADPEWDFENGLMFFYVTEECTVYNEDFSIATPIDSSFVFYKDGTYRKIEALKDRYDYELLENGYILLEDTEYLTFISPEDESVFQYTSYPAEMVEEIHDVDGGMVLVLRGVDGNRYMTVINLQGNQLIEPRLCEDLNVDDNVIWFCDPNTQKLTIMDASGNVTASGLELGGILGFTNGIGVANTVINEEYQYILINTKGERIS